MKELLNSFLNTAGMVLILLGGCGMDSDLHVLWIPVLGMVVGGALLWGAHMMEVSYDY